jgi:hypothetical protein
MRHEDINVDDEVVYIPKHLLVGPKEDMVKTENLGTVISKNDDFIFVRYLNQELSKATKAEELYTLKNRPDLAEQIH